MGVSITEEFDFEGYIVLYDRLYDNGHIFHKNEFKASDHIIVPITYAENAPSISSTFDRSHCLGYAELENTDEGVIARCRFYSNSHVNFIKRMLKDRGEDVLTFQTSPLNYDCGVIQAVLVTPKWLAHHVVDEVSDEDSAGV